MKTHKCRLSILPIVTLLAGFVLLNGCTTTSKSTAGTSDFVDDGVDYYSIELESEENLAIFDEQWVIDENGERVYLLSSHDQLGKSRYYVGDIRALESGFDGNGRQTLDRNGNVVKYDRYGNRIESSSSFDVGLNNPYGFGRGNYYPGRRVIVVPPSSAPSTTPTQVTTPSPAPQSNRQPTSNNIRSNPGSLRGARSGAISRARPKPPKSPRQSNKD